MTGRTIGFGTFFYPPSQLYEANPEKLPRISTIKRPIVIDTTTSEGLRVLVTDDCFVCPIGKNEDEAFEFLNVLFAVFITKFHRARFITKNDICGFTWKEDWDYVVAAGSLSKSLRVIQESKREDDVDYEYWSTIERQPIQKHLMEMLIDQSARFLDNDSFKNDLLIIGESGGMYQDELFSISFLNSWIVIESVIERVWEKFVKDLKRTKEERQALKNHHSWSTSHYIEAFTFSEKLDSKGYECFTKLRKLRNDIVHRKKREVTQENAWNCLNIAITLIYNQLNQLENPFEDVEYQIKEFDS
ncbi:hypothetical protein C5F47_05315 [Nitrosopumilus cobalaminigenes]|uniref:Apea-like HEPN domain-containing protein n=1 Tax=Nitrosopumilus cobalaminigenes TaxID=1470066 RepID=A0A7D5M2J9_9ARCH|nr:hypothetical protein [Nitrosopumilus cobalaminigenes]QLH03008.1 hypothetical protein C5F47_05315 [Nitrosopumilus cobalaminigenes]